MSKINQIACDKCKALETVGIHTMPDGWEAFSIVGRRNQYGATPSKEFDLCGKCVVAVFGVVTDKNSPPPIREAPADRLLDLMVEIFNGMERDQ